MSELQKINLLLNSFKIKAKCISYKENHNYFYYDFNLESDGRISDLKKFSDEIAFAIKAPSKPFINLIHEFGIIRFEFYSKNNQVIDLFDMLRDFPKPKDYRLPCLLGKKVDGSPIWMDISQNPNLLIAGTTGSGKSTLLHNILANLLLSKANTYIIDPKNIEFSNYKKNIKNIKVYNTFNQANSLLKNLIIEMNDRYDLLSEGFSTKNFKDTVIMIDEFSDLILQDRDGSFYKNLCILSQKCRAAKMYMILSTQRPSSKIIDGAIKANFPARISCKVASHIDSKVILDSVGAENLMGSGDAMIKDNHRSLERFQVAHTNYEKNLKLNIQ